MQQQIKIYVKLLGKLKYMKRMKEELSEWRNLYHANGWESSTVKIVILPKVSCKFNVISIKIAF